MRHSHGLKALASLCVIPLLAAAGGRQALGPWGASADHFFPDPQVRALVGAAEFGDVAQMRRLIKEGVNLNYAGTDGVTPLVWVMGRDDRSAAARLLQMGANPNQKINNGNSPIWLAAGRKDSKMLELMLRYHGNPNIIGYHNTTALESAVKTLQVRNIDILVKHGANVNAVQNCADTLCESAATWAAALGQFDIVARLLDLGYSIHLRQLAVRVQVRYAPPGSSQQQWKAKVLNMLKERGVTFPIRPWLHPAKPPGISN